MKDLISIKSNGIIVLDDDFYEYLEENSFGNDEPLDAAMFADLLEMFDLWLKEVK